MIYEKKHLVKSPEPRILCLILGYRLLNPGGRRLLNYKHKSGSEFLLQDIASRYPQSYFNLVFVYKFLFYCVYIYILDYFYNIRYTVFLIILTSLTMHIWSSLSPSLAIDNPHTFASYHLSFSQTIQLLLGVKYSI